MNIGKKYIWFRRWLKSRAMQKHLHNSAKNSIAMGTTDQKYCENEIVVSLTTYGKRFERVYLAIESIMQQSLKPNRIVLWLDDDEQGRPLPEMLMKQQSRGLEIRYAKDDIKAYKKLIPSLHEFPKAAIITIDDDVWYRPWLVENMIKAHVETPNLILAARMRRLRLGPDGRLGKYMGLRYTRFDVSPLNFPTGVGMVLYPPKAFGKEIFNQDVFTKICPYADDIWYKAMALLNGTDSKKIPTRDIKGNDYIDDPSAYGSGLYELFNRSQNDSQMAAVFDKYDLYKNLAKKS